MAHSPWTPELIAQVREYAAQGMSSGKMSQLIGKSRGSIIGICTRNRIRLESKQINRVQRDRAAAKPKQEREQKAVEARVSVVSLVKQAERAGNGEKVTAPVSVSTAERKFPHRVSFFSATDLQCRFPLWGTERNVPITKRFFCGAPALTESVAYCEDCQRIMYKRYSDEEAVAA